MNTLIASRPRAGGGFSAVDVRHDIPRSGVAVQRIAPGSLLFSEGDDAHDVFEIVSGTLRLYKVLIDGRRQIIGFLSGGQLLGLAPRRQYVCTAEAVTPLTVRRYLRPAFERRIDEEPGLARRLLDALSNELRVAQDQMVLLGRKSAPEKVASFLLSLAADEHGGCEDRVDLPMGRGDIADYLGLTVETVSRTFTKLKNDGLIALPTPASVEILDLDQLEALAAGCADEEAWDRNGGSW